LSRFKVPILLPSANNGRGGMEKLKAYAFSIGVFLCNIPDLGQMNSLLLR